MRSTPPAPAANRTSPWWAIPIPPASAAYNQRLSVRRANVVVEALVDMGARRAAIQASGVGKTDLAVPTPDGVKEAKNRRSVIDSYPVSPSLAGVSWIQALRDERQASFELGAAVLIASHEERMGDMKSRGLFKARRRA